MFDFNYFLTQLCISFLAADLRAPEFYFIEHGNGHSGEADRQFDLVDNNQIWLRSRLSPYCIFRQQAGLSKKVIATDLKLNPDFTTISSATCQRLCLIHIRESCAINRLTSFEPGIFH